MATVLDDVWVLIGFAHLTKMVSGGALTIIVGFFTIPKTGEELGLREKS